LLGNVFPQKVYNSDIFQMISLVKCKGLQLNKHFYFTKSVY
jgi:hypothetical protein